MGIFIISQPIYHFLQWPLYKAVVHVGDYCIHANADCRVMIFTAEAIITSSLIKGSIKDTLGSAICLLICIMECPSFRGSTIRSSYCIIIPSFFEIMSFSSIISSSFTILFTIK